MQATHSSTFDTELENWLNLHPLISLVATMVLLRPGQVLQVSDHHDEMRIERRLFFASSGMVSTALDCINLSIRAPPLLFFSRQPPTLSIFIPISYWGTVSVRAVVEALHHTARSLLHAPGATPLSGQMFLENFVNSQAEELRRLMDAVPIAVWDLHGTPIPPHAPLSLRWSSDHDFAYVGPPGEVFHHRPPGTNQVVLIFEIQRPARLVFKYALGTGGPYLNPDQLRDLVKDMVYIN